MLDGGTKSEGNDYPADVFISYSHRDIEWVEMFSKRLSKERIGDRLINIIRDEYSFVPGKSLIASIERGVREAHKLICILSPDFVESDWTNLEYNMKMLDDPSGRKGLILPIFYRECDVPYSLRIRIAGDFRKKENFERAYRRVLLALGVLTVEDISLGDSTTPTDYPLYGYPSFDQPDYLPENIKLNAFPLLRLPPYIYNADSVCNNISDVFDKVRKRLDMTIVLKSRKLWTLTNLNKQVNDLAEVINPSTITKIPSNQMTSDASKSLVIEILNKMLSWQLRSKDILFDRRYGLFYFATYEGGIRTVSWPALKRRATRTVIQPENGGGFARYYKHLAARMNFKYIGGKICLVVVPTFMITEDGYTPVHSRNAGQMVAKKVRTIYNNAFWLDVMFWINQLHSKGKLTVGRYNERIELDPNPISIDLSVGVYGDKLGLFTDKYIERWHQIAPSLVDETDSSFDFSGEDE